MSLFGIANWIRDGFDFSLPLLPEGETIWGAFSVGLFIAMWNYMGWELPSSAGAEIVNPRRTYPIAMALTLVATIFTYALPVSAGLFGGAGADGKYQLWGIEENEAGEGIGLALEEYGVDADQLAGNIRTSLRKLDVYLTPPIQPSPALWVFWLRSRQC